MKEIKTFFTNGNRLNKGYNKGYNPQEIDNSFYRKRFAHVLPPLDIMSEYENMHPGTLARLIEMAEIEQKHRHTIDSAEIINRRDSIKRGQSFAILLGIIMCIATVLLAVFSNTLAVVVFTTLAFLPFVLAFVWSCNKGGRKSKE